jgi:hypothetical protein
MSVDVNVRLGYKDAAWFTTNAAVVLLSGQIVYRSTDGQYKIGDGVTALSALTFYGGVSSGGLTVGTSTITGGTNTRILYNNNGVLGEYSVTGTGTTAVLSTSPTFITSLLMNGAAGASVSMNDIGNGYGALHISSTPTGNNYMLTSNGSTNAILNSPAITADLILSQGNSNSTILLSGQKTSGASVNFTYRSVSNTNQTASTNIPNVQFIGAVKQWAGSAGSATLSTQYFYHLTANTVSFANTNTATTVGNLVVDYALGGTNSTITTNAAIYIPTSILTNTTNGYGLYVVAPTGGTSSNIAAYFSGQVTVTGTLLGVSGNWNTGNGNLTVGGTTNCFGNLSIKDNVNVTFETTTGTKLGTATSQKIGFWNATPIVQPTTAVAAATIVNGAGTNALQDDTYDGYTVAKVVKALRNIGLLQ